MIHDTPWQPPYVSTSTAPAASAAETAGGTITNKYVTPAGFAAAAANIRNALAPRGGLAFDGTSGLKVVSTLTNQNIGTDPVSLVCMVTIPTAPQNVESFMALSSNNGDTFVTSALKLYMNSGSLIFQITGPGSAADFTAVNVASFATNYAGKTVLLVGTRDASGNVAVYINGIAQTTTTTTGGTPPAWNATITSTYLVLGRRDSSAQVFTGKMYSASVYNVPIAAADVVEIYELGGAVPYRFQFGTQVNAITNISRNSDFSAGATDWTGLNGSSVAVVSAALNVTIGAADNQANLSGSFISGLAGGFFLAGKTYFASVGITNFSVAGTLAANIFGNDTTIVPNINANGTWSGVGIAKTGSGNFTIRSTVASGSFTLDNVRLLQVGAIVHLPLDDGIGFFLVDQSANKLHAVGTATGVAHVIAKGAGRVRYTTNTNGNQQILGQQALPANARIRSWVIDSAGTPTVKLGNTSAGAQFLAAVALAAGLNDVTLLTRFCTTNNLWANSTTTDVLQHTIDYDLVD